MKTLRIEGKNVKDVCKRQGQEVESVSIIGLGICKRLLAHL